MDSAASPSAAPAAATIPPATITAEAPPEREGDGTFDVLFVGTGVSIGVPNLGHVLECVLGGMVDECVCVRVRMSRLASNTHPPIPTH